MRGAARARGARAAAAETSIEFEVAFHDGDSVGIVWHGHYYKYLELARTALLRARNLDASDLIALGFGMVRIESRCRHVAPLRYGDRARVVAWFRDVSHRICIDYEIRKVGCGSRVARAQTVLATVTLDGRLLLCTPPEIGERLAAAPLGAEAGRWGRGRGGAGARAAATRPAGPS